MQSARQPGSSFKPFIYSAALEAGNTLATVVLDAPVVINSRELEQAWRPINYSGRFYGAQRLREALVRSMNLASVRLLLNNTGIRTAVEHLAPFGFNDAALPRNGSLALGGGNAAPLDIAQAYATFANGGYAVKPYVIDAIVGPDGEMLYRADPFVVCRKCEPGDEPRQTGPRYPVRFADSEEIVGLDEPMPREYVIPDDMIAIDQGFDDLVDTAGNDKEDYMTLEQMAEIADTYRPDATLEPDLFRDVKRAERIISEQNAFLIQDAMRDVIRRGTGVRARVLGRSDLSGKTGTSNDRRDAWFAGFNSDVVGIVWVGYDDDSALGPREEGSRTALPIWIEFMRRALDGVPNHQMEMPEGIVSVRISKTTGCPVGSGHPFDDIMFEMFREDHVPECAIDEVAPDIFNTSEEDEELF